MCGIFGEDQALNLLRSGDANGAFFWDRSRDVFQVSQQGVRMPQKSTDFYPKIPTGLVLRSVKDSGMNMKITDIRMSRSE